MLPVTDLRDYAARRKAKELGLQAEHVSYADISTAVDRHLVNQISPGAFITLRIIISMTVGRGKTRNAIRYIEFKNGVFIDGEMIQAGTGMSEVSITKHINELVTKGIVQVTKVRRKTQYPYSVYEIDFKNIESVAMLNISKKSKAQSTPTTENVVDAPLQKMKYPSTYINTLELPKGNRRDSRARSHETIADAVKSVKATTQERRATKVKEQARRPAALTLAGVKATWQDAVLKYHPNVPAVGFTAKEFAIFKGKVRPVVQSTSLGHFFDWLAASWHDVRTSKFDWLRNQGKDVAKAPSLYELMRYWKIFVLAYAEHQAGGELKKSKLTRIDVDEVAEELQQAKAELETVRSKLTQTADKLKVAEQIAYAPRNTGRRVRNSGQSLTSRREKSQNDFDSQHTGEIPEWK
jgi:biotin operon repressor